MTAADIPPVWENAACRGKPIVFWFPPLSETGSSVNRERYLAVGRKVCATCPHQDECREWAIPRWEVDGLWAGLTAGERARERQHRKARGGGPIRCPSCNTSHPTVLHFEQHLAKTRCHTSQR